MPRKGFAVFDADSHVVEPRLLWDEYLDPEYRVPGRLALWREEGKLGSYLKINGEVYRDTENPNIPSYAIWRPGMTWDTIGDLEPNIRHAANEGASEPSARLRDMDAMGIDQALLYPTWFAEGFPLLKDPDVASALARAYNDWIADFCRSAPERLFAAAMIPLQNMDFALEELRRCAQLACFPAAFIRPATYRLALYISLHDSQLDIKRPFKVGSRTPINGWVCPTSCSNFRTSQERVNMPL